MNGPKLLQRQQWADRMKGAYVFINERGQPFGRMGIGRMVERAGEAARLPFPVHVHMLRHSTGYALAARGMDTRRLQHSRACLDHEYSALHCNVAGAVQGHLALISAHHRRSAAV